MDNVDVEGLLNTIGQIESNGRYNIEVGGKSVPLTGMTLTEVVQHQKGMVPRGLKSSAVGKYQIIDTTLESIMKRNPNDFPPDRLFDAAAQEEAGRILLQRRMIAAQKKANQTGRPLTYHQARQLSMEWASLPNPDTGKSYYAGDSAGNKSLIDLTSIIKYLKD